MTLPEKRNAGDSKHQQQINAIIDHLGTGGIDSTAIHDNVAAEISAVTEKETPVAADLVLIEDSEASNAKKRVQLTNLPGIGTGSTAAEFVTTAAHASLSAEVVIPGLAGSADIAGAGAGSFVKEFDSSADTPTWTPSDPATVNADTTVKSHLYLRTTDNTQRFGFWDWAPSGVFDARMRVTGIGVAAYTGTPDIDVGLIISNSDNTVRLLTQAKWHAYAGPSFQLDAFTYAAAAWTQRGATWDFFPPPLCFRITRTGTDTITFYVSRVGLAGTWLLISSVAAFDITVAQIGVWFYAEASATDAGAAIDWIRASE